MRKFFAAVAACFLLATAEVAAQGIGLSFGPGPGLSTCAYPAVVTTNSGPTAGSGTSANVNLPTGIVSGDLLLIFSAIGSSAGTIAIAGWTGVTNDIIGRARVLYRVADGTEGSTAAASWTTSNSNDWYSARINLWHGTTPPEGATTAVGGPSTAPDSPTFTPSWGIANNLWFAFFGVGSSVTVAGVTYPTGYSYLQFNHAVAGGLGVAAIQTRATSQDPAAFSMTNSGSWSATTIAVRPGC